MGCVEIDNILGTARFLCDEAINTLVAYYEEKA